MNIVKVVLVLLFVSVMSGCMPEANTAVVEGGSGFLLGLWHGLIVVFSFIGSLFSDNIAIYEVANNGGWYDFGFFLGLGSTLGGSSRV